MSPILIPADPYLPPPTDGHEILRQVLPAGVSFTGVAPALAGNLVAPDIITDEFVRTNDESPVDPRSNTIPFKLKRQIIGWDAGKIDAGGIFRLGHRRGFIRLTRIVGRMSAGAAWSLNIKSPQWDGSVFTELIASSATVSDNPFIVLDPIPDRKLRPEEFIVFVCAAGADVSWIEIHSEPAID
jgi:hypothetical protein